MDFVNGRFKDVLAKAAIAKFMDGDTSMAKSDYEIGDLPPEEKKKMQQFASDLYQKFLAEGLFNKPPTDKAPDVPDDLGPTKEHIVVLMTGGNTEKNIAAVAMKAFDALKDKDNYYELRDNVDFNPRLATELDKVNRKNSPVLLVVGEKMIEAFEQKFIGKKLERQDSFDLHVIEAFAQEFGRKLKGGWSRNSNPN